MICPNPKCRSLAIVYDHYEDLCICANCSTTVSTIIKSKKVEPKKSYAEVDAEIGKQKDKYDSLKTGYSVLPGRRDISWRTYQPSTE